MLRYTWARVTCWLFGHERKYGQLVLGSWRCTRCYRWGSLYKRGTVESLHELD